MPSTNIFPVYDENDKPIGEMTYDQVRERYPDRWDLRHGIFHVRGEAKDDTPPKSEEKTAKKLAAKPNSSRDKPSSGIVAFSKAPKQKANVNNHTYYVVPSSVSAKGGETERPTNAKGKRASGDSRDDSIGRSANTSSALGQAARTGSYPVFDEFGQPVGFMNLDQALANVNRRQGLTIFYKGRAIELRQFLAEQSEDLSDYARGLPQEKAFLQEREIIERTLSTIRQGLGIAEGKMVSASALDQGGKGGKAFSKGSRAQHERELSDLRKELKETNNNRRRKAITNRISKLEGLLIDDFDIDVMYETESSSKQAIKHPKSIFDAFTARDIPGFCVLMGLSDDMAREVTKIVGRDNIRLGISIAEWKDSIKKLAREIGAKEPVAGDRVAALPSDPLLDWAYAHQKDQQKELIWLSRQIIGGNYHVFDFDEDAYNEAMGCTKPAEFVPYEVSIMAISGVPDVFGVAAFEYKGEIRYVTIGRTSFENTGRRLTSFVVNYCTPVEIDGFLDYAPKQAAGSPNRGNDSKKTGVAFIGSRIKSKGRDLGGTHASPAEPFMRKAHMRRQHYGPNNSLVKTVFIHETLVTGDKSPRRNTGLPLPGEKRHHRVMLA